jgi:hypothetical protein
MIQIILALFMALYFVGCKSVPQNDEPFEYQFQKTDEVEVIEKAEDKKVMVQFDGVPFGQAMSILSTETGVPIVWSKELDVETAQGKFQNEPLSTVLNLLARRAGSSAAMVGGVYYLGKIERQDRAFAVLRLPPVDRKEIETAIKAACSTDAAVSMVGSLLWISDNLESLRKVTAAVEMIRDRSERSYVAEMYFIRVSEDNFVQLTADLQFNSVDVFSSAFNVEELFSMFLSADAQVGTSKVLQRPVLYLSEGRLVEFTDGKEITREQHSINENGSSQVSGYSKFSDGLNISMLLNRVSDKSYAVDVDLSVSVFDKTDKSEVPAMDKSELKSEGLLVRDGKVYYIGALNRSQLGDKSGLFSFDKSSTNDTITIWLRVRELKNS